jgi:hypothetical protein
VNKKKKSEVKKKKDQPEQKATKTPPQQINWAWWSMSVIPTMQEA